MYTVQVIMPASVFSCSRFNDVFDLESDSFNGLGSFMVSGSSILPRRRISMTYALLR